MIDSSTSKEEIIKKNTCGKTISDDRNRKVKFVWNVDPQKMLEYCLEVDRQNRRQEQLCNKLSFLFSVYVTQLYDKLKY